MPVIPNTSALLYKNPTANIILNSKTECFPPMISNKTRMSAPATSIQHHTGTSRQSNKPRKKRKSIQIRKEDIKLSLFADDTIMYIENPKDSTKNTNVNKFKIEGYKISIQKSIVFLYVSNEQTKTILRKQFHLQ